MIKQRHLSIALTTILLWSCNSETKHTDVANNIQVEATSTLPIGDNAQNALDWNGTYKGLTPCADCEGIETELTLNLDHSYILKTNYKGKEMNNFEEKGNFKWDETGSKITLDYPKENPYGYFVGENTLTELDGEGKKIKGPNEEFYLLNKIN